MLGKGTGTLLPLGQDRKLSPRKDRSFPIVGESEVRVAQSCPALYEPMDCTAHGILQARTLEWGAFPFSRGSSQPRDHTQVSYIAGRLFTS